MGRMLLMAGAGAALAAFADAAQAPRLGYEGSVFADACLAPDYDGVACRLMRHAAGLLSASAALLPVDRPLADSSPRLRYQLAGMIADDALVTHSDLGSPGGR